MLTEDQKNTIKKELERLDIQNINEEDFINFSDEIYVKKYEPIFSDSESLFKTLPNSQIVEILLNEYNKSKGCTLKYNTINKLSEDEKTILLNRLSRKIPCFAPYTSLHFNHTGEVGVCCYTTVSPVGRYPENTIKDIWFGYAIKHFRERMENFDFSFSCFKCIKQVLIDNEESAVLKSYDHHETYKNTVWPISMSFAISNACNYECLMCGGSWSSSIRKNREKKPPIKIPYDDNFIEELKEFIPHLKDVRMSGGEPFLNHFTYKILDLFIELNPEVEIVMTTNGSILNSRIKNYIDKLKNLKISISLDSVNKKTYELIRKNSNFELVMENIQYFHSKEVLTGIAVCPIIQNIYEIHDIVEFCILKNLDFYFNNVYLPLGGYIESIHNLPNQKPDDNKLPLVCLNTLRKSERINIAKYLKSKKYQNFEIQKKINGLINKVLLD